MSEHNSNKIGPPAPFYCHSKLAHQAIPTRITTTTPSTTNQQNQQEKEKPKGKKGKPHLLSSICNIFAVYFVFLNCDKYIVYINLPM